MTNDWIPLQHSDADHKTLVSETCRIVGCSHPESITAETRQDRPRAVRLTCRHCATTWFLKCFSVDAERPEIRAVRSQIEYDRLSEMKALGLAEGSERFPEVLGLLGSPHFAVVEEYIDSAELLATIHAAVSGDTGPLYSALGKLAALLARLHAAKRSQAPIRITSEDLPDLSFDKPELTEAAVCVALLHEAWRAEFEPRGPRSSVLVHDGFTPLNILYSQDPERLIVIDVETAHTNSPLVDVGNTTAELKVTFALHSGNENDAEPFIAFFLREYLWLTKAEASFAELAFLQTYFMGRGLFKISKGSWLDQRLHQYVFNAGLTVWSTIYRQNEICFPRFRNVSCVLFDFYNTLVEIEADDGDIANFEAVRNLLIENFPGAVPSAVLIRDSYFNLIQDQFRASSEWYAEIDSEKVWAQVLQQSGLEAWTTSERDRNKCISEVMLTFRRTAERSFRVAPDAVQTISYLKEHSIAVGVVTDAQRMYLEDEIARAGLGSLIDSVVISSDFGFRKPDRRLFLHALASLGATPEQSLFVGDDMRHDIFGAQQAGIRAILRPSAHGLRMFEKSVPDGVILQLRELLDMLSS